MVNYGAAVEVEQEREDADWSFSFLPVTVTQSKQDFSVFYQNKDLDSIVVAEPVVSC